MMDTEGKKEGFPIWSLGLWVSTEVVSKNTATVHVKTWVLSTRAPRVY